MTETANTAPSFLFPDWPAPAHVHAAVSLRHGGHSIGPYAGFNLGDHVGDEPGAVRANREWLTRSLALPANPVWLQQVHGVDVADAAASGPTGKPVTADASFCTRPAVVCAVLTADCLPVLFTDSRGRCVAAAHAGWRGLVDGVLEATLAKMPVPADEVMAWLGPAIGPGAFEVGPEVREAFVRAQPEAEAAFQPSAGDRLLADIFMLARLRLARAGVAQVTGGSVCTVSHPQDYFSYRRDGVCGRMASLIWMTA